MNPILIITQIFKFILKNRFKETLFKNFIQNNTYKKFTNDNDFVHYLANPANILKDLKKIPSNKINELLKDLNLDIKDEQNKNLNEIKNIEDLDFISLSSSWLKKGKFKINNKTSLYGTLTVMINSDKNNKWYGPYTYPMISISTWELMKKQVGKNGSGAGTIFWRYFLDYYYPSQFRQYTKNKLRDGTLSINDFKKIETNFYRTKNRNQNNKIDNKEYKKELSNYAKTIRKNIKANSKISVIKKADLSQKVAYSYKSVKTNYKTAIKPLKKANKHIKKFK